MKEVLKITRPNNSPASHIALDHEDASEFVAHEIESMLKFDEVGDQLIITKIVMSQSQIDEMNEFDGW